MATSGAWIGLWEHVAERGLRLGLDTEAKGGVRVCVRRPRPVPVRDDATIEQVYDRAFPATLPLQAIAHLVMTDLRRHLG